MNPCAAAPPRLRVLVLNQTFHPDVAATAQQATDLARHLARRGHEVRVVASRSEYGSAGATLPRRERVDGVEIHRVGFSLFGKAGLALRAFDSATYLALAAVRSLALPRPDVILSLTTPPFVVALGCALRPVLRSKHVHWVMDLFPDLPIASGAMAAHSPLAWLLERLSRACLRSADRSVVLGRCMEARVREKGVPPERLVRIPVWMDAREVTPLPPGSSPFTAEWGLAGRFVAMYAGNFGLGHDLATLARGAALLADRPDIRFAFVGGGKRRHEIDEAVRRGELADVVVRGHVPRERLGDSLAVGDVHLISLRKEAEGAMVPSKIFGIMAAGRPAILVGPAGSEVARVIEETGCGEVVAPGDAEGLAAAVRRLADDPAEGARRGRLGREALVRMYDRPLSCQRWEDLLLEVAALGTAPAC